jgi:hypothetical protein
MFARTPDRLPEAGGLVLGIRPRLVRRAQSLAWLRHKGPAFRRGVGGALLRGHPACRGQQLDRLDLGGLAHGCWIGRRRRVSGAVRPSSSLGQALARLEFLI